MVFVTDQVMSCIQPQALLKLVLPRASVRPGQALAGRGLACVGPARGRPGRGNSLVLARGQATGRTFVFLIGRATIGPGPVRPIA